MKKKRIIIILTTVIIIISISLFWKKFTPVNNSTNKEVKILEVNEKEKNLFTCYYKDRQREFIEIKPENEEDIRAILFMLHGYGSDARAFKNDTQIHNLATSRGYVVVYVSGFTSWNSGLGESEIDDIGFLKALANTMQVKYNLTKNQTFIAGFSNGAFMTYRIAMEGREEFSGIASVAGMMPNKMWEKSSKKNKDMISVLQVNGTADDAIPMKMNGSAEKSVHPAMEEVINYFVKLNKLSDCTEESISDIITITKYTDSIRKEKVWNVLIQNGKHSWPTKNINGLEVNELIIEFFDSLL